MTQKQAICLMNTLAMLFRYIGKFTYPPQTIHALTGFDEIRNSIYRELNLLFTQGGETENLLNYLQQNYRHIAKKVNQENLLRAYHMCIWVDQMLTYENMSEHKLSLYNLVPLRSYDYVKIDALNDNYKDAGIWINPKLPIFKTAISLGDGREMERAVANRDAFPGINGELKNISYCPWNKEYAVHNIIVPYEYEERSERYTADGNLRIGFIPVSDRSDLITPSCQNVKEGRYEFKKMYIESPADEAHINIRLEEGLELAYANSVDIVFAPEMLGTEQMEQYSGNYNMFVRRIYSKVVINGQKPPLITIMPSLWRNRRNSAAIIYRDGRILGRQEKYVPYIDFNSCSMEGIGKRKMKEFYLIHIGGVHRIAICICAEFNDQFATDFLCGQLGATLIIVPSYSHGEKDFVNKLGALFPYGTSVIWGDCCGAVVHSPKMIGGCSLVGLNEICRMGDNCKCAFSCDVDKGCLFIAELPLKVVYSKTAAPVQEPIRHVLSSAL